MVGRHENLYHSLSEGDAAERPRQLHTSSPDGIQQPARSPIANLTSEASSISDLGDSDEDNIHRRRVHFSPIEAFACDQPEYLPVAAVVRSISWADHKGQRGQYTGQVNEHMQPHGSGALVYDDTGVARTCIWKDGMPMQPWRPKKKRTDVHHIPELPLTPRCAGHDTYLHHLDIGDIGTPQDMLQEKESDMDKIDALQVHDFAFVLRSDGQWTYAIIADKQDYHLLFVVDTTGSTKYVLMRYWSDCIRLVNRDRQLEMCTAAAASPPSVSCLADPSFVESLAPPFIEEVSPGNDVGAKRFTRRQSSGILSLFD